MVPNTVLHYLKLNRIGRDNIASELFIVPFFDIDLIRPDAINIVELLQTQRPLLHANEKYK